MDQDDALIADVLGFGGRDVLIARPSAGALFRLNARLAQHPLKHKCRDRWIETPAFETVPTEDAPL